MTIEDCHIVNHLEKINPIKTRRERVPQTLKLIKKRKERENIRPILRYYNPSDNYLIQ